MAEFLAELRRRHIYRIAAVYVVIAWGIAQVVDLLSQTFALPDWIAQPLLIVLGLGLPVVLIASWMIVGAAKAGETPAELKKATATDWVLASALIVVIALIGYQQFAPGTAVVVDTRATTAAEDIVSEIADRLPNSVAVLPFDNVSPDPDDAYFAVGVHDEILSKLSKIRSLAVIARASVMQYAGTDKTIPQIAQELNVEMVMAGTVRYAGDQVRVTAQLIDGMTNLPVWTTEDEGSLSDIFAIQSDIAMNIANSLQAQFSTEEQESVEAQPTNSPEAYRYYLRALAAAGEGYRGDVPGARAAIQENLDQAIRLDPNFAMAYAWKAVIYSSSKAYDRVPEAEQPAFQAEMERLIVENAEKALALDPSAGLAHTALAEMYAFSDRRDMALPEAEEALRLSPNDPYAVGVAANLLGGLGGQNVRAIAILQSAAERDPNNGLLHRFLGAALMIDRRYEEAAASFQKCLDVQTSAICSLQLARAEFLQGNIDAALAETRYTDQITNGGTNVTSMLAYYYGRLGQHDDAERMFRRLSEQSSRQYVDPYQWALTYIGVGDYDAAYNAITEKFDIAQIMPGGSYGSIQYNGLNDPVLEEPRWVELRDRMREAQRVDFQ